MPGRNVPAVSALDLSDTYFIGSDQEYSPTDGMFSYWDNSDNYPEMFSYYPRDTVPSMASSDSNKAASPVQQSPNEWSGTDSSPFTQSKGFCFCETFQGIEQPGPHDCKSSTRHTTLCDIKLQATPSLSACATPTISVAPRALKHEPARADEMDIAQPVPRKRGRPRINGHRTSSSSSSFDAAAALSSIRRPACLPHKQVERKYREGLNMEMERLRKAVPTLLQSTDSCVMGVAKPSKGMVLAAAINYILKIEQERNSAIHEIERLGGNTRVGKLNR